MQARTLHCSLHAGENVLGFPQRVHLKSACFLPRLEIIKDKVAGLVEVTKLLIQRLQSLHCCFEIGLVP